MTTSISPPSRCILVIEPENDLRAVITLSLKTLTAWDVLPASSGGEGLELARTRQPDVILLDLDVRDVTLFARLKMNPKTDSLPVIALVPRLLSGDRVQLSERGFAGAIALPLDTSTLHETIAAIMNWSPP
ncbi:MAG: response regulator [Cyanobacteria bacterium J06639_1]